MVARPTQKRRAQPSTRENSQEFPRRLFCPPSQGRRRTGMDSSLDCRHRSLSSRLSAQKRERLEKKVSQPFGRPRSTNIREMRMLCPVHRFGDRWAGFWYRYKTLGRGGQKSGELLMRIALGWVLISGLAVRRKGRRWRSDEMSRRDGDNPAFCFPWVPVCVY